MLFKANDVIAMQMHGDSFFPFGVLLNILHLEKCSKFQVTDLIEVCLILYHVQILCMSCLINMKFC